MFPQDRRPQGAWRAGSNALGAWRRQLPACAQVCGLRGLAGRGLSPTSGAARLALGARRPPAGSRRSFPPGPAES